MGKPDPTRLKAQSSYKSDKAQTPIWDLLQQEQTQDKENNIDDKNGLAFYLQDKLIYHDDGIHLWVCLP